MTQVRSFNPSSAGTTKYLCLANTRKGYGIAPKYANAWQAWLNTQQHTDALPSGVAVPVFWELWLTLDGVYKNYGHIAVSLPDGRIWTDGRYYANIDTLNRYYLGGKGRYVGWGESVNDVKVVEGGDMVVGSGDNWYHRLNKLHEQTIGRPLDRKVFNQFVGKDLLYVIETFSDHPEANTAQNWQNVGKIAVKDKWDQQIYALQDQVKALGSRPTKEERDALLAQVEELTKSLEKAENEKSEDTILLDEAGNWLTKLWNRLFKRGE